VALFSLAVQDGTPVTLPPPGNGFSETPKKIGSQQTTGGGWQIQQTVAVKKEWRIPYKHLSDSQYASLLAFFDGTLGLGPFELRKTGVAAPWLVNITELTNTVPIIGSHHCDLTMLEV
jgi:hypothetical protein